MQAAGLAQDVSSIQGSEAHVMLTALRDRLEIHVNADVVAAPQDVVRAAIRVAGAVRRLSRMERVGARERRVLVELAKVAALALEQRQRTLEYSTLVEQQAAG